MSDCRWSEMIVDRLVDELREEDAILLEQHLLECPECRRAEAEMHPFLLHADAEAPSNQDPLPGERLLREVRRNRPAPQVGSGGLARLFRRLALPWPAYAALMFALIAGSGVLDRAPGTPRPFDGACIARLGPVEASGSRRPRVARIRGRPSRCGPSAKCDGWG